MASKLFLDANILLDLTLPRSGSPSAQTIMHAGNKGVVQLFTSPAVIHVASYYTKRHYNIKDTKRIFINLLNEIEVVDCDHTTALMAINSVIDDIEDAFQYYTALKQNLDYFISSDKKLKKVAILHLPVYNAAELVTALQIK
jgi:predicted nucleic acid-binding protein